MNTLVDNRRKNNFTLMKTEYFHTNDVYSCIGYATTGAQLDTSHAWLDTSPLIDSVQLTTCSSYLMSWMIHNGLSSATDDSSGQ